MTHYIYCIEAIGLGVCKVGTTQNPSHRLKEIAVSTPAPVEFRKVIAVIASTVGHIIERDILAWSLGCAYHGEWRSDIECIEDLMSGYAPAVDVTHEFLGEASGHRRVAARDPEVTCFQVEFYSALAEANLLPRASRTFGVSSSVIDRMKLASDITPRIRRCFAAIEKHREASGGLVKVETMRREVAA